MADPLTVALSAVAGAVASAIVKLVRRRDEPWRVELAAVKQRLHRVEMTLERWEAEAQREELRARR